MRRREQERSCDSVIYKRRYCTVFLYAELFGFRLYSSHFALDLGTSHSEAAKLDKLNIAPHKFYRFESSCSTLLLVARFPLALGKNSFENVLFLDSIQRAQTSTKLWFAVTSLRVEAAEIIEGKVCDENVTP